MLKALLEGEGQSLVRLDARIHEQQQVLEQLGLQRVALTTRLEELQKALDAVTPKPVPPAPVVEPLPPLNLPPLAPPPVAPVQAEPPSRRGGRRPVLEGPLQLNKDAVMVEKWKLRLTTFIASAMNKGVVNWGDGRKILMDQRKTKFFETLLRAYPPTAPVLIASDDARYSSRFNPNFQNRDEAARDTLFVARDLANSIMKHGLPHACNTGTVDEIADAAERLLILICER